MSAPSPELSFDPGPIGSESKNRSLLHRLDELLGRPVSMRSMALLRVLMGPVVLLHLKPILTAAWHGRIYRDAFYEPYASWYPQLPRDVYIGLLWVAAAAAVAMAIGWHTRLTTSAATAIVAYDLFLSTANVHNNRAYLVIVLAALAVAPCGRELSLDAWLRRRRGLPALPTTSAAWPLLLLRFEAATVYGASGLSKLVDPDWFGGTVTWQRLNAVRDRMEASVLPGWAVDLLTNRAVNTVSAKIVIGTELFIAIGLWLRRTRYAAVWVAICFHVAIQLSADVEVFSYLAMAALVIWAVPSTRDRVLLVDPQRDRTIAAVGALDWLARFRIEPAPPGAPLRVVDRDGHLIDAGAGRFVASRLPLTAWFALPTLLVPGVRRRRP